LHEELTFNLSLREIGGKRGGGGHSPFFLPPGGGKKGKMNVRRGKGETYNFPFWKKKEKKKEEMW